MSIAVVLTVFPALSKANAADGVCGDFISWSFDDLGELTISGHGAMADYDSYAAVPWRGFYEKITSVKLSEGITSVGNNSFSMLRNLKKVTLPQSLDKIGASAFEKCYSLSFIDIPNEVDEIGDRAFFGCYSLKEIDLALNASDLTRIGESAFTSCTALLTLTIPAKLTYLGDFAFAGCASLDKIKLPDKLGYLGMGVFESCISLTEIALPYRITEVPPCSFVGCISLRKVSFGRHLATVGEDAFIGCDSLNFIHFPAETETVCDYSLGYSYFMGEFYKNELLTVVASSEGVKAYALENSFDLIIDDKTHVCENDCQYCGLCLGDCEYFVCYEKCLGHEFPISGTFGENAEWFLSEDGRLSVFGTGELPNISYSDAPWYKYAKMIKKLSVEEGITTIGEYNFEGLYALEEVRFASSVQKIGRKAFSGCVSLKSLRLNNVKYVEDYAFTGCTSLTDAEFGFIIYEIGDYAFAGCTGIVKAKFSQSLRSVGEGAFENCPRMEYARFFMGAEYFGPHSFGYIYTVDRHYIKNEAFQIHGEHFSGAEEYARENGFIFIRTDTHECENLCFLCGKCTNADCRYSECSEKCDTVCAELWISPFPDVKEENWYYHSVRYTCLKGLFSGDADGFFHPFDNLTRAQLALILWRFAGEIKSNAEVPFTDLRGDWYREAVSWAYENGIITGKTETQFAPDDYVSREQLAVMLYRFLGSPEITENLDRYPDCDAVSPYAREAVTFMTEKGIITGSADNGEVYLLPRAFATRAQSASIFMKLYFL